MKICCKEVATLRDVEAEHKNYKVNPSERKMENWSDVTRLRDSHGECGNGILTLYSNREVGHRWVIEMNWNEEQAGEKHAAKKSLLIYVFFSAREKYQTNVLTFRTLCRG